MGSCLSHDPQKMGNNRKNEENKRTKANDSEGMKMNDVGTKSNSKPNRYTDTPHSIDSGTTSNMSNGTSILAEGPVQQQPSLTHHTIELAIKEGKKIIRGLYDYTSAVDPSSTEIPDLNFKKGDIMEVLKEDGDWWLARSMATGETGYVPNTYVALENSIEQHDWFHGKISRKDTEKILVDMKNVRGSFLIRESETIPGAYSLSILDVDVNTLMRSIKHYRIRDLDNGGCYISTKQKCSSLFDLVKHYSGQSDGLCFKLTMPCLKIKPIMYDLSRETKDHWEIDRKELVKRELIGSGNFGEVYRGVWKKKIPVAIKTLRPGTMEVDKFLEEAATMKKLRHPKIVTLFAVCTKEEPIFIVTELMLNGCLLNYLRNEPGKSLKFNNILDIAAQVADGMRYIENENHIHRDLAARNILVGDNNMVKIGDFGLARAISEETYEAKEGAKFPIKWTAIEAAMYGKFTIKSDVWAFGILLVELVTYGGNPYPGMSNSEVLAQLERGFRHQQPNQCPDDLYEVMQSCWKKKPDERPTFDHLFHLLDDFAIATQNGYAET